MKPQTCEEIRTMRTEDVLSPQRKNSYKTRLEADYTYSLVQKNIYRPMSEIQHDKEIPRKARRLIRYLKMRAMGAFEKAPSLKSCAQEAYELSVAPKIAYCSDSMLSADTVLIEEQALKIENELILAQLDEMSEDELAFMDDFLEEDFDTSEEEEKCLNTVQRYESAKKGGWSEHTLLAIVHSYSNKVCPKSTCILEAMDHVYEHIEEKLDKTQKAGFAVNVKLENGTFQARSYHELQDLLHRIDSNYSKTDCLLPYLQYATTGLLLGGFRGKKKGKGRKRTRKIRPKRKNIRTMDCSPGNVYESSALMVTDATGALNIVIALNNPQQIFTGVTATGAQDLANNWDAYSVERVSMSTQIRAPINARQGEWNLVCDHDSSPPSTAITQNLLLTYTDKRSYSSQAAPRWSVTPRKLSQCEYISAPAADPEPAVIVSKGKYDWNTPPSNGFMYVKLIGGPASTNIGTIYVRVHVTAWYKRRLAIAVPPSSFICPMLEEEDSSEESEKIKKPKKKKD